MGRMNRETERLLPVLHALLAGWDPREGNRRARRHFYYDGPAGVCTFEVHWHCGEPSYTVGNQGTTSETRTIEWLEEAVTGRPWTKE